MRFGRGIVADPAVTAFGCYFMLRSAVIGVHGSAVGMGTGFGVLALRTGIAAEGVIAPSGISVSIQLASAAITLCVIAVHIPVFVRVDSLCVAVFTVSAGCTFSVAVEIMVKPAGVAPSFGHRSALGTLGLIAVHLLIFDGVNLCVAVGTGSKHRHRQDGHDHQNREKRTQNF